MNHLVQLIVTTSIIAIVLVWSWDAVAQTETNERSNIGQITLANGDRIPAEIVRFDGQDLQLRSTLFQGEVSLKPQALRSFGLQTTSDMKQDDFLFRFRSGSQIQGKLLAMDDQNVQVQSLVLGKVEISIDSLLEIVRTQPSTETQRFSAIRCPVPHTKAGSDARGWLKIASGTKGLKMPVELTNVGSVEIAFKMEKNSEFELIIAPLIGESKAVFGISSDSVIIETKEGVEFAEFSGEQGIGRLIVNWDKSGFQLLNHFGKQIAKLPLKPNKRQQLIFNNQAQPLLIQELICRPKPVAAVGSDLKQDQVVVWHRDQTNQPKIASKFPADATRPERIDRVWFGARDSTTKQSSSPFICQWIHGDRIACSDLRYENNVMTFKTSEFKCDEKLATNQPAAVFLPAMKTAPKTAQQKTPYRLAIDGVSFSGSYQWGDEKNPIRWQFFGFSDPVTLNMHRKIEISRNKVVRPVAIKESTDRIVLKDGSIIPCRIEQLNEQRTKLVADAVSQNTVATNEVQCLFFNSSNRDWQKRLTSESVQRALMLPRFSRELPFTHVLIGKNGDLLRGSLIGITEKKITFESRLEPLLISRENVVGIVGVPDPEKKTEQETKGSSVVRSEDSLQTNVAQSNGASDKTNRVVTRIDCGDDFVVVGNYVSFDEKSAVIKSDVFGDFTIEESQIGKITFNSELTGVSHFESYMQWQMAKSTEPRWETVVAAAPDAMRLLDQPAPDFELPRLVRAEDAKPFRLSDQLGKIVVLDFWSIESQPCVRGLPEYLNVLEEFPTEKVTFAAINQGNTASSIKAFVKSEGWPGFTILLDSQREVSSSFNVSAIPHLTIIDQAGKVHFIKVGYSKNAANELRKKIKQLLQ